MQRRRGARFGATCLLVVSAACGGAGGEPRPDLSWPPTDTATSRPPAADSGAGGEDGRPSIDAGPGPEDAADVAAPGFDAVEGGAEGAAETGRDSGTGAIVVENLSPGETLPHDLVVLQGTAAGASAVDLEIGGRRSRWPVADGRFRALGLLKMGANQLVLTAGASALPLTVTYQPPSNPRFVRFLYIVAADGDGRFEVPPGEPGDQASALARLRVGARLMQAFTAETMRRAGFGRLTFRLARDPSHEPIVEIWKSKLTTGQARAMDGNALWSAFFQELGALPDRPLSLDVAVMSMTRYLPATKVTQAHTALGGGRLGLFGSGTLYAHAASLEEIPRRFADARLVDTSQLRDDSAGRGTYWANYATGLGAMEHELGHCLSLPHPASHRGFMWRGFDHLNRTFVIAEPRSRLGDGLASVAPMDEAGLDRSNAVRLRFHRWLAPAPVSYRSNQPPTITVDARTLRISSPAGVRHVQYLVAGEAAAHDEHLAAPPPTTVTVPLAALRTRLGGASSVNVSTIDDDGNIAGQDNVPLP